MKSAELVKCAGQRQIGNGWGKIREIAAMVHPTEAKRVEPCDRLSAPNA